MASDYYSQLGLSPWASQSAIERAYRSRILAAHPDRNPEDDTAAERACKVIEAYQVLKDPFKRQQYDRTMPTPAHAISPYCYRENACPLWLTRFFVLLLFFSFSAGIFYVVANAFTSDTLVFRPSMETIEAARNLTSTATHPKNDRGRSLHILSLKETPNPDLHASIVVR